MERAKALGINPRHVYKALLLIRDLRKNFIRNNLDPRASRIALIFAEITDKAAAGYKLTNELEWELIQIAKQLFEENVE